MKLETSKKAQVTPQSIVHTTQKAKIDTSMSDLIMDMLSKIYANPLIAAVREYVSNGVDSHTAAGQTRPVEVTLPTSAEPKLIIRDYGRGMDMFDILTIYGNFGTSDKRESDDFIGGFGIGSKSGLAISDIIDVESIKDGVMNKFRIKRSGQEIITQFVEENVPAQNRDSGTRIEIDVDHNYVRDIGDASYIPQGRNKDRLSTPVRNYMAVLAGWSKSQVVAKCTNDSIASICNDHRIRDVYRELDSGYITNGTLIDKAYILSGFLVGDVFYEPVSSGQNILETPEAANKTWGGFRQPAVVKLDIGSTKVAYSREQIEFNGSQDTRNHVLDKLGALASDIRTVVSALQNDPNITPQEYVKRLCANGIALDTAANAYAKFLKQTPTFDLNGGVTASANDIQPMEISKNGGSSFTVGQSDMSDGKKLDHEMVRGKLVVLIADGEALKAARTYRRYVKEALEANDEYGYDANSCMAHARTAMDNYEKTGWRSPDLEAVVMYDSVYAQYAYKHMATAIRMDDVIEVVQTARMANRKQRTVNKNARVYFMKLGEYANCELTELNDVSGRDSVCVLQVKSKYAFNTKTAGCVTRTICNLTGMELLCIQNVGDYPTVQNRMPQAWFPTDDELEAMLEEVVRTYSWAANDPFCVMWGGNPDHETITYVDSTGCDRRDDALEHIDTYLQTVAANRNNPFNMSGILRNIDVYSAKDPLMAKLDQVAKDADAAGPAHKVTYAMRLGKSLTNARCTMLTFPEAQQFMNDIARDYRDEINHLKQIY